jgi:TRAP-type mannitol/chloroaromatic compound transport system substrate-binding protein
MRTLALLAGLAVAAATAIASHSADAQTTKLRFQSAFPPSSTLHENFKLWTDRVRVMSNGRLDIEAIAAGTVVPAFEVLDATHKSVIDGAHSGAAYWVGKQRAAALFGVAPGGPFGMDMMDYMGWLEFGGGLALYNEFYQQELKRNVVPIPMGSVANQVLGWFAKPVKSWEDLKGRKCRETGITAEVFSKSGMSVVNMPGGEIVPAAQRGVIDCGEWVGPAEDIKIGFHTVWKHFYMPSVHEPATITEVLINGDVWKKLTPDLQQIVKSAAWEITFRHAISLNKLNFEALKEMTENHGVKVEKTPDDIIKNILKSWDEIAAAEVEKNPFFKKVYASQREYAGMVVPTRRAVFPNYNYSADHYWPEKK